MKKWITFLAVAVVLVAGAVVLFIWLAPDASPQEEPQVQENKTLVIVRKEVSNTNAGRAYYAQTESGQWFRTSEEMFNFLDLGRVHVVVTKQNGEDYIVEIIGD